MFYVDAKHIHELTRLQSCNKEHDFVFVMLCWRMIIRNVKGEDAELDFEKLLHACKCRLCGQFAIASMGKQSVYMRLVMWSIPPQLQGLGSGGWR